MPRDFTTVTDALRPSNVGPGPDRTLYQWRALHWCDGQLWGELYISMI